MAAATATTNDWARVGDAITARMEELGWDQSDLVRVSGVSDATIRKLQHGTQNRYHRSTLNRVATALGWEPDAVWYLLAHGDQPQVVRDVDVHDDEVGAILTELDDVQLRLTRLQSRLRDAQRGKVSR